MEKELYKMLQDMEDVSTAMDYTDKNVESWLKTVQKFFCTESASGSHCPCWAHEGDKCCRCGKERPTDVD